MMELRGTRVYETVYIYAMRSLHTCIVILLHAQPVHAANESDVDAPELPYSYSTYRRRQRATNVLELALAESMTVSKLRKQAESLSRQA